MIKFDPKKYYMGDSPWLMKYTKPIEDEYPDFRFISHLHDLHYLIMLSQRNIIIRIIMKICYDIIYGVMGIVRGIFSQYSPGQVIISIVVMVVLIITTPYYLYKNRNRKVDLGKL